MLGRKGSLNNIKIKVFKDGSTKKNHQYKSKLKVYEKYFNLVFHFIYLVIQIYSQEKFETNREGSNYKFKVIKNLDVNDIQDQGRTSTCWSFSSLSFLSLKF